MDRRSRTPCPACRGELGAPSTWREIQDVILQMRKSLKFEKAKNTFIGQKMKRTMDELQRVKKQIKDVEQIIEEKEENEKKKKMKKVKMKKMVSILSF